MSEVYRARDATTGRVVALKVFASRDENGVERFARESRVLEALHDPTIVEHVAHGVVDDTPYLAMEWLEGEGLDTRLKRASLSVDEVLTLSARVAAALAAAHAQGVIHRDIKPGNVFLCENRVEKTKILDFGIARVAGGDALTRFGEALGTPAYMAPEQARGGTGIDIRADIFSLGCVLYESLAGKPPFWADHPLAVMAKILMEEPQKLDTLVPDAPPTLIDLIESMLAKDPTARPSSGGDLALRVDNVRTLLASGVKSTREIDDQPTLGSRELSLWCVLLVAGGSAGAPTEQTTESIFAEVTRHGGSAETLLDGSIVISLQGRGPVLDQAPTAAQCALAVRSFVPMLPMALATGRADLGGGFPVGEVIDRGVRLLAAEASRIARSESLGGIAIDEMTASLLDRRFDIATTGSTNELMRERTALDALTTQFSPTRSFVGRDREISQAIALYETSLSKKAAALAMVTGALGFGKSRFIRELTRALEARHPTPTILSARAEPKKTQTALSTFAVIFTNLFGLKPTEEPEVSRHRVRARVFRVVRKPNADRLAPILGSLVGVQLPAPQSSRSGSNDTVESAIHDFLAAELALSPVAIAIDDIHHADTPSLVLIEQFLQTFKDRPFFVVGSVVREEWQPGSYLTKLGNAEEIGLSPLDREAARTLIVEACTHGEPLTEDIDRIIGQADGNPLYLEELARALGERPLSSAPPSIVALVQARVKKLNAEARRVLRASSVFGGGFSKADIFALLGASNPEKKAGAAAVDLDRELDVLVEAELLSRQQPSNDVEQFSFKNALIAQAAYAMLTEEDRLLGHRLAAERFAGSRDRDPMVIADHFQRANDDRRAAIYLTRGAELALETNDFEVAIERAEQGALAGAAGPLLGRARLLQSEAHRHLGDNENTLSRALDALSFIPPHTPPWWAAAANAVLAASRLGRTIELDELVSRLVSAPLENAPAETARIAHYLLLSGRHEPANLLLHAAIGSMRSSIDDAPRWGWVYRAYATQALIHGDTARYLEQLELTVRAFGTSGDAREAASEQVNVGFAQIELGLYKDAETVLRGALGVAEAMGLRHVTAAALQNLGEALARLGQREEASQCFGRSISLFHAQRNRRMEGNARTYLANLLLDRGRFDDALAEAMLAAQLLTTTPGLLENAMTVSAKVILRCGRPQEALAMAKDAYQMAAKNGAADKSTALRLVIAKALIGCGKEDEAKVAIAEAQSVLMARAARIQNEGWRRAFLESIDEHCEILELFAKQ